MPPVQQTFSIIPELGPRARTNNQPIRPMTSKQIKKAHKEANKKPKISKAEQRRLELAEQERIRKEFEKEKQAARARAARDRKKEKELAQKEARKRSGKPLVDVRPSQDTIARFVRGNGTGKKRDGTGSEVAAKMAPLVAVAEETDTHAEHGTDDEVIDLDDAEKSASKANDGDGVGGITEASPAHAARRNSQRSSQGLRQIHDELRSSQLRKRRRLMLLDNDSQKNDGQRNSRRASQATQSQQADDTPHPCTGGYTGQAMTTLPGLSPLGHKHITSKEWAVEPETAKDDLPQELTFKPACSSRNLSLRGSPLTQRQTRQSSQPKRAFKRCESFNLDLDDLVDDESMLQLDGLLGGNSITLDKEALCDDGLPLVRPHAADERTKAPHVSQKEDSQSSLDFDMLETMNTAFDEMTGLQPMAQPLETTTENDARSEPDARLQQCPRDQNPNAIGVSDSFGDDELDDGALLCLDTLGAKHVSEERRPDKEQRMVTTSSPETFSKAQQRATSYGKDDRLIPDSPQPKTFIPLSTQAILSDLNDFFPSPSQQARELDDLPPSMPMNTPCPPTTWAKPTAQAPDSSSSPQLQKRFFTSSGSNELFSLALQRSRRTAALEELQRKECQRREAGLLAQARKEAAARQEAAKRRPMPQPPPRPQPRPQLEMKVPALAPPPPPPPAAQARPKFAAPSCAPRRMPPAPSRPSCLGAGQSGNISTTRTTPVAPVKAPQPPPKAIIFDGKENLAHEPRANEQDQHDGAPNASQETEYGGDWIDEIWVDGLMV